MGQPTFLEDTAINRNADKVIDLGDEAHYWEIQASPRSDLLPTWFAKCDGLTDVLKKPVVLIVLYLTRGGFANPPSSYTPSDSSRN